MSTDRTELLVAAVNALPDLLNALEKAEAAVERVRALHKPTTDCESGVVNGCQVCINTPPHCGDCYVSYPCPTIRAIDGDEPC